MIDSVYELVARNKDNILKKIENLVEKSDKYREKWRDYEFDSRRSVIGAEDGSLNFKRYVDFILYAANAVSILYENEIKSFSVADVDVLYPYKRIEDRLNLYRTMFEFKIALKNIKDADIFLIDGSLISSIIKPFQFEGCRESQEYFDEVKRNVEKLEIVSKRFQEELGENVIDLEYLEYLETIKRLIEAGKEKIVAVSKTSTSNKYFGLGIPDIAIFEKISKNQGFSEPIIRSIDSELKRKLPLDYDEYFKKLKFTVFYSRLSERGRVLLFEVPREINNKDVIKILERIKSITVEDYPYLLKRAHDMAVIKAKDIENIANMIGIHSKIAREVVERW